jgi:glutathione S-transferase
MKLYADPMACSLASHIALVAAGLPHQVVWVDPKTWTGGDPKAKRTADGREFLSINPKGYVPALELDDGSVLTEGSAILQYIGDRAPGSGLVPPAGSMERYHLQEWLNYIASEIHKQVFTPFFGAARQTALPADELRAVVLGILEKRLDYLELRLKNRRYLVGVHFTVADAYLLVVLNWSLFARLDLARWPAVAAYYQGLNELPTVREVQHQERELRQKQAA